MNNLEYKRNLRLSMVISFILNYLQINFCMCKKKHTRYHLLFFMCKKKCTRYHVQDCTTHSQCGLSFAALVNLHSYKFYTSYCCTIFYHHLCVVWANITNCSFLLARGKMEK